MFILFVLRERERGREKEQAREGKRERERENPKQSLCCQHRSDPGLDLTKIGRAHV